MPDVTVNRLHFGSAEPVPEWVPLSAGPLSLYFSNGAVPSPKEIRRLEDLKLDHLRADLHLSKAGWEHSFEQAASLTCFSVNPQVHAFDNATLVENLRGLKYVIESAVEIAGGRPIAVSPLTFRPRYQAGATRTPGGPAPDSLPLQVDARQTSLFGAGWTACSLKYLADPHVRSPAAPERRKYAPVDDRSGKLPFRA
jgi:hypothetical protein